MPRVLHVSRTCDLTAGGPAHSCPQLCAALSANGVDVSLASFRSEGVLGGVRGNEAFALHLFRSWNDVPSPRYVTMLRREMKNFDLVHIHGIWHPPATIAAAVARSKRVPYIVSPRGMLQGTALTRGSLKKRLYASLFERKTLSGAAALHFLTQRELDESRESTPAGVATALIPNGVDISLAATPQGKFRQRHPEVGNHKFVLFVGRLCWSKALDLQADAFILLQKQFPDLKWVLIGNAEEDVWPTILNKVRAAGVEHNVHWLGMLAREECTAAMADAEVSLLTSRHEAHSMTLNESMAVGVPVVATATAVFDEILTCGGVQIAEPQPDAIAAAVSGILRDPGKAASMRTAGRNFVAEKLSWSRVATDMQKLYSAVLERTSPGKAYGVTRNHLDLAGVSQSREG